MKNFLIIFVISLFALAVLINTCKGCFPYESSVPLTLEITSPITGPGISYARGDTIQIKWKSNIKPGRFFQVKIAYNTGQGISWRRITSTLGYETSWTIPYDYPTRQSSLFVGVVDDNGDWMVSDRIVLFIR